MKDAEIIGFAEQFLSGHAARIRKDIDACFTPGVPGGKPAYFPALMALVGFIEMLGGLYEGNLSEPDHTKNGKEIFLQYAEKYMWPNEYAEYEESLDILYKILRHKVAHLAHPYYVTPYKRPSGPRSESDIRVIWEVGYYQERLMPVVLIPEAGKIKKGGVFPRDIKYDHKLIVDINSLTACSFASVRRYFDDLKKDRDLREKFDACMGKFFP